MIRLFSLILLLHLYLALRLVPDMPPGVLVAGAALSYLIASAALMPLAMLSRQMEQPRADRLAWAGFVAMGVFSSLFVLTLLRDLALIVIAVADLFFPLDQAMPRFREASALVVAALALLFTVLGFVNARRLAGVRSVDVPIEGLPAALHGFIIVQITDIHIGPTIKRGYVERIVLAVNALEPDMIAVTGDMVDGGVRKLAPHTEPLSRLASRHGSFFVTGNHEYYSGANAWVEEMRRLGMRVLMNEHALIEHDGETLLVAGVTDYGAHHYDLSHASDPAAAIAGAPDCAALRLLLAHQPRSAVAAERAGFHLQLSGHTHGGQFLPWNFFVRLQQPFTAGLHRLGELRVYTSRGAGYWGPPKRLGAPSEITRLRLVAARRSLV